MNHRYSSLIIVLLMQCSFLIGQSINMPYQGSDTTTLCNGTLYDHAGPSGNYSNYANGYFYLDIPGGSLSLTFTQFWLEGCCDYVRIYDGLGTTGTLLLTANGSSLPNGGSPIIVPSGKATIRFSSDGSVTYAGFTMTWSGGGTTAPTAQFTSSNTNPPLAVPVSFTNTSVNSGAYTWDFGDGNTSTDVNPSHSYSAPGNYQVQMIATNCFGSDTSNVQNITVMNAPQYSVTPDSLYTSVNCGANYTTSFTISDTAGGTLYYDLSATDPNANPFILNEGFESSLGSLSLVNGSSSNLSANVILGSAAAGNGALLISGYESNYNGLRSTFTTSQPDQLSYYIKQSNQNYHGYFVVSSQQGGLYNDFFYAYVRYNTLYVLTYSGTYSFSLVNGQYNFIELRNIDWVNKDYDLYINGTSAATALRFRDITVNGVNELNIWNNYTTTCYFDQIRIGSQVAPPASFSPSTGILNVGNNQTINVTGSTLGLTAGQYIYDLKVSTNSNGADSVVVIPLVLDVIGAANANLSSNCLPFDTAYTGTTITDSLLLWNNGCDTLDFTSITSSNADLSVTSGSSVSLAPDDSIYLHFSFNPNVIGTYNDSVMLTGPDTNIAICLNALAIGAPAISIDSSGYTININGCLDSASFPVTIYNSGQGALHWSTTGLVSSQISDDFESSTINSSIWSSWGPAVANASNCSVINGSRSLTFYGSGLRFINTVPLNTQAGGTISFILNQGTCDNAESSEGIYLDYSTDNGLNWNNINYNYVTSAAGNLSVSVPIPIGAQGQSVMFRLKQEYFTGSTYDHWIIDDFSITSSYSNAMFFNPDTGTVGINDSVTIIVTVSTAGLPSGTYNFTGYVDSDDPSIPILSFPVTVNINGTPDLQVPSSCVALDTIMTGTSTMDSIMIINDGCGDLVIGTLSNTLPEFSASIASDTVFPGDTAYIQVNFTAGSTLGLLQDTVIITSNDTVNQFCINGYVIGAPNAVVNPDSIYINHSGCNDTINIPVTISNPGGLSPLDFMIQGGGTGSGALDIVMLKTGSDISREYPYTYNAIAAYLPNANITESTANTSAQLTVDLNGADVLVIPEQEYMSTSVATALAPAIQSFANAGNAVVVLYNGTGLHNAFGLTTFTGTTSIPSILTIPNPGHPVVAGVNPPFYQYSATQGLDITSPGLEIFVHATAPNHAVAALHDFGPGKVGFYGFDFYNYDNNTSKVLANLIEYAAANSLPDWITISPDSGQVATNDSVNLNVQIITTGLGTGTHTGNININTNDPLNPNVIVPVVLVLDGYAEIADITGCVDFDSVMVGAIAIDSALLVNTGCDTLEINSASSSSGVFNIASTLPIKVAPGDSAVIPLQFQPTLIGSITDSIFVVGNDDSTYICVTGKGIGAPQLSTVLDTMEITVNKCNGFSIEKLNFSNIGQGAMAYDVRFGSVYSDTSLRYYYTSGASTNHSFPNVPATADTIFFKVVVNGDFDNGGEVYAVYVEGTYLGNSYVNYLPVGTNDTAEFYYTGPNIGSWLSDGTLTVTITNTSSVNPGFTGAQDFHFVEVSIGGGAAPSWLTLLSPSTGTLPIGGSTSKNLLFDANGLSVGQYTTNIVINSNDPLTPNYVIPVIFNVVERPEIRLSDTCLTYPMTLLGDTAIKTFWIYNDGCKSLNVSGMIPTNGAFKVTPANGSVPAGDSLMVTVRFIPATISNFSASLLVNNNDTNRIICLNAVSNALPVADFTATVINNCSGQVSFSDHSLFAPTGYFWDFGDGNTSLLSNPVHSYSKPGTYNVLLRVSNSAGFDTITKQVTVNPLFADFSMTNDTVLINTVVNFYDSSLVANKWNWFFGDGGSSNNQNPTHTYTQIGNYQVSLNVEDANGCQKSVNRTIYVVNTIGLNEVISSNPDLTIYPNPASDMVIISSDQLNLENAEFHLFDAAGKEVKVFTIDQTNTEYRLDIRNCVPGYYQLMIMLQDGTISSEPLIIKAH